MSSNIIDINNIFKSNNLLRDECISIIESHNNESFVYIDKFTNKNKSIITTLPDIDPIKYTNEYYEIFIYYHNFINYLETSIVSMGYSIDDLYININRSDSFIVKLYDTIDSYKKTIINNIYSIKNNQSNSIDLFINSFTTIDNKFINNLYKLMNNDNFINVGSILINKFMDDNKLTDEHLLQIKELNSNLKLHLLMNKFIYNYNYKTRRIDNYIQTFNLIPVEGIALPLESILNNLFGVQTNISIKTLSKNLQLISTKNKKNIGIIIICKNNDDIYYNINNLFNYDKLDKIKQETGVNNNYIELYKLLHIKKIENKQDNIIWTFNIDSSTTDGYILWSNDMKEFKYKSDPVDSSIIKKLVRNEPSIIIEEYNKRIEDIIIDNQNIELKNSYNDVKYLNLTSEADENKFRNNIINSILSYLRKYIKKNNINNTNTLHDSILDIECETHICDIIFNESSKLDFSKNDSQFYNTLLFEMTTILNGIKKDIILSTSNDSIFIIIEKIINSNITDNLYTKLMDIKYINYLNS
jgi:hypothetical protein